jgi:hypothetical protein
MPASVVIFHGIVSSTGHVFGVVNVKFSSTLIVKTFYPWLTNQYPSTFALAPKGTCSSLRLEE